MRASRARGSTDRAWLGYLIVGLGMVGVYYLTRPEGMLRVARVVIYCAVSASAAVAVLFAVARGRPRPRRPWLLLGLSQVVYAAADTVFYLAHYVFGSTAYPSLADLLYLAHYPLIVVCLTLLIRERSPGRDLPSLLDAAVLAVAASLLSWLILIGPQARLDAPPLAKAASLGYPVADLAMLAVGLRLVMGAGRRPTSFFLLTGNLVAIFAADTIYALQQLHGTYHAGNFLDAIWLTGNLALGAAALHPTVDQVGERAPARDQGLGPGRLVALSAAALVAPAMLLIQYHRGYLDDLPVIACGCAVLFILTIARLAGVATDQRRLAITDGLTGLYTRRFLEASLPLEFARARRAEGSLAVFIIDVDYFKSINDRYGHLAGDRALSEIASRLRTTAREGDVLARYGGEEFALLVPGGRPEELASIAERLRTRVASSPVAVSEEVWLGVTVSVGSACYPAHADTTSELVAAADRALYAAKAQGRNRVVVGAVPVLPVVTPVAMTPSRAAQPAMLDYLRYVADCVDARLSSYEHSRAISRWTVRICTELGLDEAAIRQVELAARLHDIGKIIIPEEVLTKSAELTEEEWQLIRRHPDSGYRMTRAVPGLAEVAEIIRQHHERFDGWGYPNRLAGHAIRIEARILAVCDTWAAMRSDRTYQRRVTEDQARAELRIGSGSQFDPDVVNIFLDLHERGIVGALGRLTGPPVEPNWDPTDHHAGLSAAVRNSAVPLAEPTGPLLPYRPPKPPGRHSHPDH